MDAPITTRTIQPQSPSCENSSHETSLCQATLMIDQSRTSGPATSPDTRNVTFSQAADCGPLQPGLPDGLTNDLFGPAPVRASRSARRAKATERMIQGICGRTFIASSVPVGPLSSWESRLRERLATVGSTESALIWKVKTTPAGASISRLAPSMRHTNETDYIGSRRTTVAARDGRSDRSQKSNEEIYGTKGRPLPRLMLEQMGAVHSYNPTPTVADVQGGRKARSGSRSNEPLLNGLLMSYSPTPQARDGMPPHSLEYIKAKKAQGHGMANLNDHMVHHFETALGGPTPNGSSAPSTAKRGAPNPAFPFWLMGFPDEWTSGALAAMQSFRSSRRKSSRRSSKQKQSEPRHEES